MTDESGVDAGSGVGELMLRQAVAAFRREKISAERAFAQLRAEDWHRSLDEESNSVAVIVQHLAGNLRSRWRDVLTSDGEKPDRDRDAEFVDAGAEPAALLAAWDEGWRTALASLDALTAADLVTTVTIRAEPLTVAQALMRSLAHTASHVGQIIMLAKHWRGPEWETLSIPRART